MRIANVLAGSLLLFFDAGALNAQQTFSTGSVRDYIPNGCAGPDLPRTIEDGQGCRFWYGLGGFQLFSRWENGDVWGSDFRDAGNGDLDSQGGSDVPHIYFFSGHGRCQNPPTATSSDNITVCGNFGDPDNTVVGTSCRWGNGNGNLRFAFIDASCPMDRVSLANQWFPAFRGLHMATGHSGTANADTLDSGDRSPMFAAYTSGSFWVIPHLSVCDAWMVTGTIDIQNNCCAIVLAAGANQADAIDRRDHEKVKDNRSDPTPNWFAWRWICR